MLDYASIKKLAKADGVTVKTLLALSTQHDPFYVGTKADVEKAKWFAGIYRDMGSPDNVHVRRVHYAIVARGDIEKPPDRSGRNPKGNGLTYENTEKDWKMLTQASKYARYLDLVPMQSFVDRRNPEPTINAEYYPHDNLEDELSSLSVDDIIMALATPFRQTYNPQLLQAYHLEIWCEKSTMNDVIMPVAGRYGANVVTGLGEMSITAVRDLVSRVARADKAARIFYISDFDPAGEGMPVSVSRKIEYFLRQSESQYEIKLRQLMLDRDQCIQYELPRTPIKESDRRKADFESRHGAGATELDALEALYPGEMESLLTAALDLYFDKSVRQVVTSENWRLYQAVRSLVEDRLAGLADDLLDDIEGVDQGFEVPAAGLVDDSAKEWIFDSELNYKDQLVLYKEHKASPGVPIANGQKRTLSQT